MVEKARDAFLTIGELSSELGVPQHVLRYWETRFPALRPLTRAGNRRYYRPEDVALARRIARALNHDGYTIKGVQKLLAEGAGGQSRDNGDDGGDDGAGKPGRLPGGAVRSDATPPASASLPAGSSSADVQAPPVGSIPPHWLKALIAARDELAYALSA